MSREDIQEMHPTLKKESILSKIYNVESSIETFEAFSCRIILIIIRYFLDKECIFSLVLFRKRYS